MARGFQAPLTYRDSCQGDPSSWSAQQSYDLRVNHPLTIGGTQIFLIGHGYAPVITVRDAQGHKLYDGPTVFLPESSNFESFGVVKAPGLRAGQDIGLEGLFYPTFADGQRPARSTSWATTRTPRSRCSPTSATSASTPGCRSRSTPWTRRT